MKFLLKNNKNFQFPLLIATSPDKTTDNNIEWGLGKSMNFFVSLSMPCDTMCDTGRLHHQASSSRKLFLKRFEKF